MTNQKDVKKEATTLVQPEKVPFFDTTTGKSVKTGIYLILSGALTALVTEASNNPDFLGQYTQTFIFICNNIFLVAVKNLVDPQVKNV